MSASSIEAKPPSTFEKPLDTFKAHEKLYEGEDNRARVDIYEVDHPDDVPKDVGAEEGSSMRRMNWKEGAVMSAKSQIGIGILGIPSTFGVLGFVPGLISLLLLCAIATLSSWYIAKIRVRYPQIQSVGDFGYMIGGRWGSEIFGWSYCIVFILFAGSAIQTLTIAFNAITLHGLCSLAFAGIVTGFLCIVGSMLHEMERVAVLSYAGLSCIIISVCVQTIAILVKGKGVSRPEGAGNEVKAAVSYPLYKAMNAVSTQLFAVMGTPGFFSISAEMERPSDFLKSVYVGQGFVCTVYVLIACLVYGRAGKWLSNPVLATAGGTLKIVCYAIALFGLFVGALLFAHIGGKYIFVRALRGTRHLTHSTPTHWMVWSACFCFTLIIGFVIAEAVPVFDDLLALIGALTGGFLVVGLTGMMGIFMLSLEYVDKATGQTVMPPGKNWVQRAWNRAMHHGTWREQSNFWLSIVLLAAGCFVTGCGTYAAAVAMAKDSSTAGQPFSCQDNSK